MASDFSAAFYLQLGNRLRQVRKRAGLTQRQMGARLGLKGPGCASYLTRLESGRLRGIKLHTVVRCLNACNEPVGAFLLQLALDGLFGSPESIPTGLVPSADRDRAATAAAAIRLPAGFQRKQRLQHEREVVRALKNEVLPLILPYCTGRHEFKSGAYLQAAEAFYKAWKRVQGRVGRPDQEAVLKAEFDRVEQIGLRDGLRPEAMRIVRETVEKRLTGASGLSVP
jgi:transcriptional regulator with XRE-family HTH domain